MEQTPPSPPAEPAGSFDAPSRAAKNWACLVLTLALVGGGLVGLHFLLRPAPVVRTLVFVPAHTSVLGGPFPSDREIAAHQKYQMALAKSRLVLNSALNDPRVANLPTITNKLEPVEWLEQHVRVDFEVAPEILRISMSGRETAELATLVDAVREAYMREITDDQQASRVTRQNVLEELVRRYEMQLRDAREAQRDEQERVGGLSTDYRGRMFAHLTQNLSQTEREWLSVKSQLSKAKLALKDLEEQQKNFDREEAPELAIHQALAQSATLQKNKAEIDRLEKEIASASERSGKGMKDPTVIALRDQVRKLKDDGERLRKEKKPEVVKELKALRQQQLQHDLAATKSQITTLQTSEAFHAAEFERLSKSLASYTKSAAKVDTLQPEIARLEEVVKKWRNEVEALKVELAMPTRVRVIEPATIQRNPR